MGDEIDEIFYVQNLRKTLFSTQFSYDDDHLSEFKNLMHMLILKNIDFFGYRDDTL